MRWFRRTTAAPLDVLAIPASTGQVVVMQAQIAHAGRIIKGYLDVQSDLDREDRDDQLVDALLEIKSALGLAKPRPAVPINPGPPS